MAKRVLYETGIRRLGSKERGFSYRYPGTDEPAREERVLARIEDLKVAPAREDAGTPRRPAAGGAGREGRVLARREDLKVPPAGEDARIARSPSAKVQAIGYDSAGRLQYRYHDKHRDGQEGGGGARPGSPQGWPGARRRGCRP